MDHNVDRGGITCEERHHRRIDFRGYRRSDGQYEVEGRLLDRKCHDFTPPGDTRMVKAGEAIHDMWVTLVFDAEMTITDVKTSMHSYPYLSCPGGGDTLQSLVGLRIGAGWNSEIRKRLPNCDTCTHMKEILTPLASAAYQTMTQERLHLVNARAPDGTPVKIDSCHAYSRSRSLVKKLWPDHTQDASEV